MPSGQMVTLFDEQPTTYTGSFNNGKWKWKICYNTDLTLNPFTTNINTSKIQT